MTIIPRSEWLEVDAERWRCFVPLPPSVSVQVLLVVVYAKQEVFNWSQEKFIWSVFGNLELEIYHEFF